MGQKFEFLLLFFLFSFFFLFFLGGGGWVGGATRKYQYFLVYACLHSTVITFVVFRRCVDKVENVTQSSHYPISFADTMP